MSKTDASSAGQAGWLNLIADPVRLEIIRALAQRADATATELAAAGAFSKPTLRRHLDALVGVGLVESRRSESDGQTPGRPPVRFSLSADIRASVCMVFGMDA